MTTKVLTGIYTATYNLTSPVTTLSITASGYIYGGVMAAGTGKYTLANAGGIIGATYGVSMAGRGVVSNTGVIEAVSTTAGAGIVLGAGGVVSSGVGAPQALISGYYGVSIIGKSGTVTNGGTIVGTGRYGVVLRAGGVVTNGAVGDAGALIRGQEAIGLGAGGTVINYGSVVGAGASGAAVFLAQGGAVTNAAGGLIESYGFGVGALMGAATVTNQGVIRSLGTSGAAVILGGGGVVTNGDDSHTHALIEAAIGAAGLYTPATVNNFGTILSTALPGSGINPAVYLKAGGAVTNGDTTDTTADIEGPYGVAIAGGAGAVANFGTIGGLTTVFGVILTDGGSITNGAASDTVARVQGYFGVGVSGAAGTVHNYGTIEATGTAPMSAAVYLSYGGVVTNGADGRIHGAVGVYAKTMTASVTNLGTITGGVEGAFLVAGGQVVNGSATDSGAVIQGQTAGVAIVGPGGTLDNFGTIRSAVLTGFGVYVSSVTLTNGAVGDTTALITSQIGIEAGTGSTIINYGTISGSNSAKSTLKSIGVQLGGGAMTNQAGALVIGYYGVGIGAASVLSNYGTIEGTSGQAVALTDSTDRLNAEAGSVILGDVLTKGGTVAAVSGVTTMSGLVTTGSVVGAGTLTLKGGASDFAAGTSLTVASIAVAGAATTVQIDTDLTYAKIWTQTAGTLTVNAPYTMTFTGKGDGFSGTVTGGGAVSFKGGSDTFNNLTLASATASATKAAVTLQGTITLPGALSAASTTLTVAATGASLTGGGTLLLNGAANAIAGAGAGSTLTIVDDVVRGAGLLGGGQLTLVNQAGGTIDGNGAAALAIDTGAATITNAGLIEATGAGGVTIAGAIVNTGTLAAIKGDLTVNGAVTGAGRVKISGATAFFAAGFSEDVAFTGTTGVLELARSQSYKGKVSGFSKTGTTQLDLNDIAFSGSTKATYSGNATSGLLTVTDGTHTANIKLTGDYTASTFVVADDGHGGTLVHDPAKAAGVAVGHGFVAAMAAFGARPAGPATATADAWREPCATLVRPRAAHA